MADYAKDSEKQAALRRQIEKHPVWQYPPEERLQHNREWQSLYPVSYTHLRAHET